MFYTKDGTLALSRVLDHGIEYVDTRTGVLLIAAHKIPEIQIREPFILAGTPTNTNIDTLREVRKARQEDILKAIAKSKDKPKKRAKKSSTPRLSKRMQVKAGHLSKEDQIALIQAMKNLKIN